MRKKMFSTKNLIRAAWIIYALASIIVWVPQIDRLLPKEWEFQEYMNELEEGATSDYTVICFDKERRRCAPGDFRRPWGGGADGGDGFICVIPVADREKIGEMMEQFQANICRKNRQIKDLHLSVACGFAMGKESDKGIEKVYQMADNRMYENKKEMKIEAMHAV